MNTLSTWATRHNIPQEALDDLHRLLTATMPTSVATGSLESDVQARIRLEAGKRGWLVFRNNVGVLKDERGVPVRYGLANDSASLNARVKSADLIGCRPVLITPGHVGQVLGQMVSIECKRPGWKYRGTDRERAQLKWAETLQAAGAHAVFATSVEDI